jgi:hypothetical protein
MLRKKIEPRMGDLKLLRARIVPTWCKSLTAKAKARERRPSRSLPLLSRRRNSRKVKTVLCVDLPIIGKEVPTPQRKEAFT